MSNSVKKCVFAAVLASAVGSASAIPVTVTIGGVSLSNLGGNPGVYYDAFSLSGATLNKNLNYNDIAYVALQNYAFTVGSTGPNSNGRITYFSAARTLSVNGTNTTLSQNGQVTIGSTADTLSMNSAAGPRLNLTDGLDHYQVIVDSDGLYSPFTSSGTHTGQLYGEIILYNVEDAPIAALTGNSSLTYGKTLALDASASFDPDKNSVLSYNWDFNNDGITDLTTSANVLNLSAQDYSPYLTNTTGKQTITLTVRDNTGLTSNAIFETSISASATDVPEPGTFALAGAGLVVLRLARKRKTRPGRGFVA